MLPFTNEALTRAVDEGLVTQRRHPTLPYTIYNYSPAVQYSNKWDEVTLTCRGLILDDNYNIVARPWKKFFNLGQVNLPIQFTDPVEVMDKADGSLGILYNNAYNHVEGNLWIPDSYAIATRGSFVSDQAIHATQVWNEKYADAIPDDVMTQEVLRKFTFLFEIVYPENRIVLDYDGMDDLILLGAVEKSTGYYVGPNVAAAMIAWPGPVVEVMPYKSITEALSHTDRKNAEGFVIRSHNFMVKIKQPDYLTLHRIVTNLSARTVWEQLASGRSVEQICNDIPDEFHAWVRELAEPLLIQFDKLYEECYSSFNNVTERVGVSDRKKFAIEASKSKHRAAMFMMLDGKPIREYLWKLTKPKQENGLRSSEFEG